MKRLLAFVKFLCLLTIHARQDFHPTAVLQEQEDSTSLSNDTSPAAVIPLLQLVLPSSCIGNCLCTSDKCKCVGEKLEDVLRTQKPPCSSNSSLYSAVNLSKSVESQISLFFVKSECSVWLGVGECHYDAVNTVPRENTTNNTVNRGNATNNTVSRRNNTGDVISDDINGSTVNKITKSGCNKTDPSGNKVDNNTNLNAGVNVDKINDSLEINESTRISVVDSEETRNLNTSKVETALENKADYEKNENRNNSIENNKNNNITNNINQTMIENINATNKNVNDKKNTKDNSESDDFNKLKSDEFSHHFEIYLNDNFEFATIIDKYSERTVRYVILHKDPASLEIKQENIKDIRFQLEIHINKTQQKVDDPKDMIQIISGTTHSVLHEYNGRDILRLNTTENESDIVQVRALPACTSSSCSKTSCLAFVVAVKTLGLSSLLNDRTPQIKIMGGVKESLTQQNYKVCELTKIASLIRAVTPSSPNTPGSGWGMLAVYLGVTVSCTLLSALGVWTWKTAAKRKKHQRSQSFYIDVEPQRRHNDFSKKTFNKRKYRLPKLHSMTKEEFVDPVGINIDVSGFQQYNMYVGEKEGITKRYSGVDTVEFYGNEAFTADDEQDVFSRQEEKSKIESFQP